MQNSIISLIYLIMMNLRGEAEVQPGFPANEKILIK